MEQPVTIWAVMGLGQLMLGVNTVAAAHGWMLIDFSGDKDPLALLPQRPPDAIVFDHVGLKWLPQLARLGTPTVGVEVDVGNYDIPRVMADDAAIAREAARLLLGKGLTSFAFYGMAQHGFSQRRATLFRQTIQAAGMRYDGAGEEFAPSNPPGLPRHNEANLIRWLQSLPKPTGLFAACDMWGRIVLDTCRHAEIRVPEQVAVVGVDNHQLVCELTQPAMSSVIMPWDEMGRQAGRMIDRMLRGERLGTLTEYVPTPGVVERRSTDMLAVDDPNVAAALAMIQARASKPLSVSDILRGIPTHRRTLERNFRRLVGRHMKDEIRRVHVEQAKRLLIATQLAIAEVAERSGFANAKKLAEAFRRETGLTATEYRRRYEIRPGRV